MDMQNDQNSSKNQAKVAQGDDQTKPSTVSTSLSDIEDVELNEEQLDIISGGGDGVKVSTGI